MRTVVGILIGFLFFQAISLRLYPLVTDYLGAQAYEKAFGELGQKLNKLRMAGNEAQWAISAYYHAYGILPLYASDLGCSSSRRCEGVRQADGVFYIESAGLWMAIEPRLEPGHNGVSFGCGVSLDENTLVGTTVSNCQPLGAGFTPRFPSPSFDCSAAQSAPQRLICASDRLTALDIKLSEQYTAVMQRASPARKKQITREHIEFINERESTCTDAACIEQRIRARLSELDAYTPDANRIKDLGA